MASFYELPAISPTMELGTIVEWKLGEGQAFDIGAVLAVIGTDKANMDAEIFDAGVLIRRLAAEGDELPPGFPIAIWGKSKDEDITGLLAEFEVRKAARKGAAAPAKPKDDAPAAAPVAAPPAVEAPPPAPTRPVEAPTSLARSWHGRPLSTDFLEPPGDIRFGATPSRVRASPLAKKIAAERGISLARVHGTGPGGRIVVADLERAPSGPGATVARPRADESKRHSPMRKTIAKRLLASHQDVPTFFLTVAFDGGAFVALRANTKASRPDLTWSYNDLLLLCVARALREHPEVNASWTDDAIVRHGRVDVGIAVALPDGLITPVVRGADALGLAEIGPLVKELASRAREQKLKPDEYTGSTFTISNLGMMGIEQFTAIINPPESAILAVGALEQVPVVSGGALALGWRMKCTMTCDHRVIDGATGARFLQTVRRYVECPALLWVA